MKSKKMANSFFVFMILAALLIPASPGVVYADPAPTPAFAENNSLIANVYTVKSGDSVALIAEGHRQSEDGAVVGDERYFPVHWISDYNEYAPFIESGGVYTSNYTAIYPGSRTLTATFQKDRYNGTSWVYVGEDPSATRVITINIFDPIVANASLNSVHLSPDYVLEGGSITIIASGHRQSVTTATYGDERYIPASWESSEAGKSGVFTESEGSFTSTYEPDIAGYPDVTVTFAMQIWDGDAWMMDTEFPDTKAMTLWVMALEPTTAEDENNTINANTDVVIAGDSFILTAHGDRQLEEGVISGDERYIPTSWESTEAGKSGLFTESEGSYISDYVTSAEGEHEVTVTFTMQIWDGDSWEDTNSTDTKYKSLGVMSNPTTAEDENNTVNANSDTVIAGESFTLTAHGDRQLEEGETNGDERYIPTSWESSEAGKSGFFMEGEGSFTSSYVTAAAGEYEVTVTFTMQIWEGDSWEDTDSTDTKSITLTVNAAPVRPLNPTITPTASPIPMPVKEIITVDIEDSNAQAGNVISKAVIERTTQPDGSKHDDVSFNIDQARTTINSILAAGSTLASILIPDTKDEVAELLVSVPQGTNKLFTDNLIGLGITTDNVKVIIPNESLQGFTDDLYFHFVPVKEEIIKQEVGERANKEAIVKIVAGDHEVSVVGRPMKIETNMQNRKVTLVMPLGDVKLSEEEMNNLGIYVEHSDGTKELLRGVLVPYNNKGEMGLQFTVNKFSLFTLVQLPSVGQHDAYMKGYADGTFKPENNITRAEMAAVLSRVIVMDTQLSDKVYSDVPTMHWAKDAITHVTMRGLMKGYADGTFAPEKSITRAEMSTLIALLIDDKYQSGQGFSDIAGHWSQASILKVQGAEIISGYDDGAFRPDHLLTRAEAATIMNKALGRGPKKGIVNSRWVDVTSTYWALMDIEEASMTHTYQIQANGEELWVPSP